MVTVVELRKMATKQKIEGRSKMNKAQLEKALGMPASKASPKKAAKKVTKKATKKVAKKATTSPKCKGGICKKVSSPKKTSKVNEKFAAEAINDGLKELHPDMKFNDEALKYIISLDTSKLSLGLFMDLIELSGNEAQLHGRKVIFLQDVKVTIKDDSKLSKLL